jgi:hypothetical protein
VWFGRRAQAVVSASFITAAGCFTAARYGPNLWE